MGAAGTRLVYIRPKGSSPARTGWWSGNPYSLAGGATVNCQRSYFMARLSNLLPTHNPDYPVESAAHIASPSQRALAGLPWTAVNRWRS